jgi:hypothetical protein
MMKALFGTVLLTVALAGTGPASAFDECGPGCHASAQGACVVDGWGTGIRIWNECPAGAHPRPPCPRDYAWHRALRACFPR